MDERRRSRRAVPAQDVIVTVGGNRPARVMDVSSDGAKLELATALNPRGECRIELPLPNRNARIKVRVVHCELTGVSGSKSDRRLVYRAGVRFLDVDPELATLIHLAYPAQITRPQHSGPIKVKVNVDNLEQVAEGGEHGAN